MLAQLLEIVGTSRSRPMEGLRGVAVGLVFLRHSCAQLLTYADVSGPTRSLAEFFTKPVIMVSSCSSFESIFDLWHSDCDAVPTFCRSWPDGRSGFIPPSS